MLMKNPASSGVSFNGKSFMGLCLHTPICHSSPPQAARYSGFFRITLELQQKPGCILVKENMPPQKGEHLAKG